MYLWNRFNKSAKEMVHVHFHSVKLNLNRCLIFAVFKLLTLTRSKPFHSFFYLFIEMNKQISIESRQCATLFYDILQQNERSNSIVC